MVLCEAASRFSSLHGVATTNVGIFDIGQTEGTTTVLIASKFCCIPCKYKAVFPYTKDQLTDRGLGIIGRVKFDNACASGSTIWLILDLRSLDLANGGEELDQILVAGRPGQLRRLY